MEKKKISHDITNKFNSMSNTEKAEKTLLYTISDILAVSGILKYMIFEDYKTHKEALRNVIPGARVKSFDDIKKKLEKHIKGIDEIVNTLEIRNMYNSGIYKAQDIHFGIYSVIKSVSRLSEEEIYNLSAQLTSDTTNANFELTNRLDFVRVLSNVMDISYRSHADAIKYVSKYHQALTEVDAEAIKVGKNGNINFYDIAPERN